MRARAERDCTQRRAGGKDRKQRRAGDFARAPQKLRIFSVYAKKAAAIAIAAAIMLKLARYSVHPRRVGIFEIIQ